MASGLKIRRAGVVVFDSWLAAGGVCMGIFSIPLEGWTITFPGAGIGRTPIVIYGDSFQVSPYTYDEALGCPRFVFRGGVSWPTDWRPSVGIYLK
ncbi:hypothetical protein O0882_12495 [Janthinobacterium sp. SUN073]|uniref:hypothetical protein n=1 Tax=Janthinobacterium sp. SUN073 TaxID=3004102 RepID=UPI0025AEF956|nr:hypothetical protein [Janthinobacterium sp. SUN073]MDN2697136.1 hypothetical protein [Janthinobacterium sp. SUN073]